MARTFLILVVISNVVVSALAGSIDGGELGWLSISSSPLVEEVMEMDSEINRRILQTNNNNYISYGTLLRDNTPCSRPGASYYNCRPGAQRNPYTRGCNTITRCARS